MDLLLPFFLGAGLLIGLPVALHFLKRKPRLIVVFPSLQFLGNSAILETRRNRIRRWLTLLLRCLLILLICAAFSRPFWNMNQTDHGRAILIAVDNSFSMQTTGRWQKLRTWALSRLSDLQPGDRAGLLLMNPAPRWLVPLTDQTDRVRETLETLQPGFETTHYDPALRMAGDVLSHSGAPEMVLVWMADEQQLGWNGVRFSDALPAGVKIDFAPAAAPPARQAALTMAHWENDGGSLALRLDISQYVPDRDTRHLSLSADGKVISRQDVSLVAGKNNSVLLPLTGVDPTQIKSVKVELDPDDLPSDDTFYAVPGADESSAVLLTAMNDNTDGFDFLRHAVDSTRQVTASPLKAQDLPDTAWPLSSVVVVRGEKPFQAPLSTRLDAFVNAGGAACFFLNGGPAETAWMNRHHLNIGTVVEDSAAAPLHLRNWDATHPLIAPIAQGNLMGLLGVEFYRGLSVESIDAVPLATWENGKSAIAEVSGNGLHFLVCGFDFDRATTNWPIHASFVPFIHSALTWLSRQQPRNSDWRVGDTIPMSAAGTWKQLDGPGAGAEATVSASVRPTEPGLYQFTGTAGPPRLYAVNLKPEESDPEIWATPKDFLGLIGPPLQGPRAQVALAHLSGQEVENKQRAWWWLLLAAVVLVLGELRLANRTSM